MSKMAEYAFETDALYDGTEGIELRVIYKFPSGSKLWGIRKTKNKKGDSRWTLKK